MCQAKKRVTCSDRDILHNPCSTFILFPYFPGPQSNKLMETMGNNNLSRTLLRSKRHESTQHSSTSNPINSRYGTSLLIGVIFIFATRVPPQLTPFILPEKSVSTFNQIIYILLNLPLLICSALNPWMYAYHNLDLKPVMRRLVKKLCRKIVRKDFPLNEKSKFRNGGNENQSFMTGYQGGNQISMFASIPRRSTFLHSSAAVLAAANPVATGPIQAPVHPVLKTQRSVSSLLRSSFKSKLPAKKARRTKSCGLNPNQAKIPIVTIWDGNTVKDVTKPEDEML